MLKIDLHIHSINSGHAYGTFYDILREAKKKKMNLIAITDHGPALEGSASESHFHMGYRAPEEYEGVKILWGCESNVIDLKGNIDLPNNVISRLDLLLVGLHKKVGIDNLGKEKNTEAIINCFKKNNIHIFTHPSSKTFDIDYDKVFQAACDNNVLLEINLSALHKMENGRSKDTIESIKQIVDVAKRNNKKVIVNSDAHFLHEIGDDSILAKYKKQLSLTDDMIINNYPDELLKFIEIKKKKK